MRNILSYSLATALLLGIFGFHAEARKKSYKFKESAELKRNGITNPKATAANISDEAPDSAALAHLFPDQRIIMMQGIKQNEKPIFTGFDKRLNSTKESFFIINPSPHTITGVSLCLTYHTPDGRMLTRRYATIPTRIPAGETRKIDLPSWDTQRSFYYLKSEIAPSRGNPFDVSIVPIFLVLNCGVPEVSR